MLALSDLFSRPLGAILTGLAAVALCLPVGYCSGFQAAKNRADAERAAASVQALNTARSADEAAAVARVNDALDVAANEGKLTDAIQGVPDTLPDDTRVALGCQRLRASGTNSADLPAVCRSGSGDGTQAVPVR